MSDPLAERLEYVGDDIRNVLIERTALRDRLIVAQDALSNLLDWVKEGCPDGGHSAIDEAEEALKRRLADAE